jgi:hypothetical protein
MIKKIKIKVQWLIWLLLIILWNYTFPNATPFEDVIVAIILSLINIFITTYE